MHTPTRRLQTAFASLALATTLTLLAGIDALARHAAQPLPAQAMAKAAPASAQV